MEHHTKDKGDLAVAFVIAHLIQFNIRCCTPLSEHLPFDIICLSPDLHQMKRLQVKYTSVYKNGKIELPLRNSSSTVNQSYHTFHDRSLFDAYALYCSVNQKFYYINNFEIYNSHSFILRLDYPKAVNGKGFNWGEDFEDPLRLFESQEDLKYTSLNINNEIVAQPG